MKYLAISLLSLTLLSAPAVAHHVPSHPNDVTVKVNGLVCDFCARTLEKTFGQRPEIEKIAVNLDTHEVAVDFKQGSTMPTDDITKLITDSGYAVVEVVR